MNSLEYQYAVRRRLGLDGLDIAALPADVVLEALNDGLKSISAEREWHWLFVKDTGSTVANVPTIAVPPDYVRSVYLSIDAKTPLEERSLRDLTGEGTLTGAPAFFASDGSNFALYPTPSEAKAFVHAYYRSEPTLVLSTDAPLMPDSYSPWLVAEAAVRLPIRVNSQDTYTILREEIAAWKKRVEDNVKRNAQPPSIRRTKPSVWTDV